MTPRPRRNTRPRDELGRPLPYGSAGVDAMPEGVVRTPAETLAVAWRLLRERRPFQAHEVFEDAWKGGATSQRELWRGLAQLAVGITHAARGNLVGAARLIERGATSISPYSSDAPHGIDIDALVHWSAAAVNQLGDATPDSVVELDLPLAWALVTQRLVLRPALADDAAVYRELWTERDPRVPPHRRIGPDGRPTVEDIAERIRTDRDAVMFSIEQALEHDVIGYCGLRFDGHGSRDEPELAYELLRRAHGFGYATEAAHAVVMWAADAGYQRLWAGVRSWNVASRNVLRKLDFVETDEIERDPEFGDSLLTTKSLADQIVDESF